MSEFDKAFELLMINEGGFVNDAQDEGGETKFGISQASHPGVDIANLTEDAAKEIYEKDYWGNYGCDKMPWAVAWTLFDCIVNHGPSVSIQWLQRACGVTADGLFGPATLAAVHSHDAIHLARDITLARRDFVETVHNYQHFKNGWDVRHLNTLIAAVQFAPQEDAEVAE